MSLTSIFQDIADAIRTKTGKSESIYPVDMASEIENISTGTGIPVRYCTLEVEETVEKVQN